jgi:hypothetical protein
MRAAGSPGWFRRLAPAALAALLLLGSWSLSAEFPRTPEVPYENLPYDGDFTFARLRFEPVVWGDGPYAWGLDLKWNHDYPLAERNFMKILVELTSMKPNMGGGNIIALDDPDLFAYPWAYLCEVGFWQPTEEEARALRTYLLKGGFLVVDDFIDPYAGGPQWRNWDTQIRRVFPGVRLIELDSSHPIFHAFFDLDVLDFSHPAMPILDTRYYGIFENNDPNQRLMVLVNYNMDVGDFWEWSEHELYPIDLTKKGFRLGVNYVIYGLTH